MACGGTPLSGGIIIDFVYWSFLRFELRHNLRLSRVGADGEVARRALRAERSWR